MKATFIIASFFAAIVVAAPAAVDTRSESAVEIEARQVCSSACTFPVSFSFEFYEGFCVIMLTNICRAPLRLAGCATPRRLE